MAPSCSSQDVTDSGHVEQALLLGTIERALDVAAGSVFRQVEQRARE